MAVKCDPRRSSCHHRSRGFGWLILAAILVSVSWRPAMAASDGQPIDAGTSDVDVQPHSRGPAAHAGKAEHLATPTDEQPVARWSRHLPPILLRPGPLQLMWWQWFALALAFAIALGVGRIFGQIAYRALGRFVSRTSNTWDDTLLSSLRGPFAAAGTLATLALAGPLLDLKPPVSGFFSQILRVALLLVLFWSVLRSIDVLQDGLARAQWATARPASRSLLSLGARTAKIFLAAMAVVAAFSYLGYPVTSILAGLGIGGIALALAAQKTVENLFGAFSLGIDQPIREGDFVKVEDFVGTVETIGLRSTRIRTLDRTLVTIPNGKLAEMRLESYTARDRIRLACDLGVVYGTSAAQMREIIAGLEKVLRDHPKIWPDAVVVRFKAFGESSLNIEIMAWFTTSDWGEFQLIRQDVLLQFMEVVEQAGSSFAFPTRTLHVERAQDPT